MANFCKHDVLSFASGGFYVICKECNAWWTSRGQPNDSKGYEGLAMDRDVRYNPTKTIKIKIRVNR